MCFLLAVTVVAWAFISTSSCLGTGFYPLSRRTSGGPDFWYTMAFMSLPQRAHWVCRAAMASTKSPMESSVWAALRVNQGKGLSSGLETPLSRTLQAGGEQAPGMKGPDGYSGVRPTRAVLVENRVSSASVEPVA